ncbi:MAG: hypothetical protein RRC34_13510 [Lentisphaeria bacterium]|nr:hypothetical protein [Lentisphaeria bacterium]
MFPLFHADYADVEVVAREFLSPKGTMRYVKGKNSVVVIDYPENLENIQTVIDALEGDGPPPNIRINVAFDEVGESGQSGWGVDLGGPVIIEDGKVKHNRVDIHAGKNKTTSSRFTSQQILTVDGKEAQIWVGETVQEPRWVFEYGRRRAWWSSDYVEYNFGASLQVRPKLLNNGLIQIDVYPRLTSRTGEKLSVDVKELTVSVLARDGQTVSIGGMDQNMCEAYSKILGRGRVFNGTSLNITLTPTVEKTGAKPPPPGTTRQPVAPIHIERSYQHGP